MGWMGKMTNEWCCAVPCEAGGCYWGPFVSSQAELIEAMMSAVTMGSKRECIWK